jgi:phage shock protein C
LTAKLTTLRLKLMNERLHKSSSDRVIAGVCGGLGEYFGIDPTIVRIIFVILTIWGGLGILLYVILFLIMPEVRGKDESRAISDPRRLEARHWIGGGLILFGVLLLADMVNDVYDIFPSFQLGFIWPLIFIYFGVWFLYSQKHR